jgi:DNA-directed RNA polymerase specialized sigma24 family protein
MGLLEDRVEKLAWRIYQNSAYDPAMDYKDLAQVGHIAVIRGARKHYQKKRGASFETYALVCARAAMIDTIRKTKKVSRNVAITEMTEECTVPSDGFFLMVEQVRAKHLSPMARKLLEGAIKFAGNLDKCTLNELRRYIGLTPREFNLARLELTEKLYSAG